MGVFQFLLLLFKLGVPIRITSSAIMLKICAITAGIKKYKSIIQKKEKKKKNKHDKIELLQKYKLNSLKGLVFKTVIDLYISHDGRFSVKKCVKGI